MNPFPSVILCGSPHVGKSTLACALTRALRETEIAHYVLRAAPDGEGDWACDAPPVVVRQIRQKSAWSDSWVDAMCHDIARRHLPLLVDMGGRPTPDQERILDQCGHAILLTRDPAEHAEWTAVAARHNLTLLADLRSDLNGADALDPASDASCLRGALSVPARGGSPRGPVFEALVPRLAALFQFHEADLLKQHLAAAPWPDGHVRLVNVDALKRSFGAGRPRPEFRPEDIPLILAGIPAGAPIALYGRLWGPLALALSVHADVRWLFAPNLGWVAPASTRPEASPRLANEWLVLDLVNRGAGRAMLNVTLRDPYLPYEALRQVAIPSLAAGTELEISGKIPMWLLCGLGAAYRHCQSVSVFDPRAARVSPSNDDH
ncbi:MAG: CRISPR-associated protein Csx3 [Thermoflexales bacterium]